MSTPITEPQQAVHETVPPNDNATVGGTVGDGATFSLDEDDPRRTDNRGGLEATLSGETTPAGDDVGASALGTTGADMNNPKLGAADDVGAAGSGTAGSGRVDMSTTGMAAPDAGPPGAGPVEGSASGATPPRVEVTDIGLVDVNTTDVSELAKPTDSSE